MEYFSVTYTFLEYDTMLTSAGQVGFRAGIYYPDKPVDVERARKLNIWEVLLIIMDGTLKDYLELDHQEALNKIKELIKQVKKY